ncbi:MAG: hypothetical protein IOMNBAOH_00807 [Rhodocyclaceae bacterium]|nr:hypothetical protein [Rhodocyclaceae bacterium]
MVDRRVSRRDRETHAYGLCTTNNPGFAAHRDFISTDRIPTHPDHHSTDHVGLAFRWAAQCERHGQSQRPQTSCIQRGLIGQAGRDGLRRIAGFRPGETRYIRWASLGPVDRAGRPRSGPISCATRRTLDHEISILRRAWRRLARADTRSQARPYRQTDTRAATRVVHRRLIPNHQQVQQQRNAQTGQQRAQPSC